MIGNVDRNETLLAVELPPGAKLADTTSVAQKLYRKLSVRPEVNQVFVTIGTPTSGNFGKGGSAGEVNKANIYISLVPREKRQLSEDQILQVVDGLLEMVGVKEMRDLLPSDLSTGMKRSVAIARALAAQPECVLYDEPTTMVDPMMGNLLGDLIARLKLQLHLTSVVVTHDMRLAKKLADRIVFLYEGRAIFFGPYKDMEKSPEPIIHEFLELDELKLEA